MAKKKTSPQKPDQPIQDGFSSQMPPELAHALQQQRSALHAGQQPGTTESNHSETGGQQPDAHSAAARPEENPVASGHTGAGTSMPGQNPAAQHMPQGQQPPQQAQQQAPQQGADSSIVAGLDPSDINYVPPLIECLAILFRLNGKPVSTRFLLAGMPISDGTLHPSAVLRAARSAGMQANVMSRPSLNSISPLTLPCILLLRQERACVLVGLTDEHAEVIFPENGANTRMVPLTELAKEYTGYAIFAKIDAVLDRRTSGIKLLNSKKWFWGTISHFWRLYTHVISASLIINLLTIASPLFFMNVYDRVVPNKAIDTLWVLAIGVALAYLFDFVLRNLRSYFTDVAGKNADTVLASKLMSQLMALRMDAKPDSTGSLANNLREFESLREFFSSSTLLAFFDLPFLFIFIAIVFVIAGPIGFIPLLAVPVVVGICLLLQLPSQRTAEEGFKENMQKNALLVEIINGLETVKTTMSEGRLLHAWEKVVSTSSASSARSKAISSLSVTVAIYATQMVSVLVIISGVYRVSEGLMSMGALIAANMLASRAMAPLSQVASMLTRFQQSRMALKSLDMLMTLPTERMEEGSYVDFGPLDHTITFENVTFAYPNAERNAVENISLSIKPGERVGILGRMGSGKSTLGRLAIGLYQPKDGAVKFGGIDIRQMDMADLRSRVGYLAQDNYLFYGSVRDNIAIGVPNADDRMILRAATIAGVADFVRAHPAGFGMQVGERGMALSGGQRQAVALARALLTDPDVLILDEPSSNMDNSSEANLKKRLASILHGKTLILVTHRVSVLDLVDRLIVVDYGHIVADGPKQAVLEALRNPPKRPAQGARAVARPEM